jgi:hypothetical protein
MTYVVVRVVTDAVDLAERLRYEPRQLPLELGQNVLAIVVGHDSSPSDSTSGTGSSITAARSSSSSGGASPFLSNMRRTDAN